jgi:hypothetical protein
MKNLLKGLQNTFRSHFEKGFSESTLDFFFNSRNEPFRSLFLFTVPGIGRRAVKRWISWQASRFCLTSSSQGKGRCFYRFVAARPFNLISSPQARGVCFYCLGAGATFFYAGFFPSGAW